MIINRILNCQPLKNKYLPEDISKKESNNPNFIGTKKPNKLNYFA